MKVAHFLSYYPGLDGLTSFCRGLGAAFREVEGFEVPIVSFRAKPVVNGEGERVPVVVKFPHRQRHPFDVPSSLLAAFDDGRLILDGAVLHGTFSPQVYSLARVFVKRGIPYIFMPHDPYVKALVQHRAVRKFAYWHLFEKWVIRHSSAVQLLSSSHEEPLRRRGCQTSVYVLGNGCDPRDLGKVADDARVPGREGDFVIQYLGRMDRNHKGLDLLIRGFSEFLKKIPAESAVRLVLSGNDWVDRPFLEALSRELHLGHKVVFTGRLPEHAVAIHSRADLSVLCSRFDGYGLTILEAMVAGRPVLVSKAAGVSTEVEKAGAGFVVDPQVEEIAKGLWAAWNARGQLEAMGRSGRSHVVEHLAWRRIAERSAKIYAEVFGRSN